MSIALAILNAAAPVTPARLNAVSAAYSRCLSSVISQRPQSDTAETVTRVAAALCRADEASLRDTCQASGFGFTGDCGAVVAAARRDGEDSGLVSWAAGARPGR
jgi:hypothetical protein